MTKKDIIVKIPTGLHARPAADLVKLANTFESEVFLYHKDIKVNAKDIWDVLNNGIESGDPLTVECNGSDEANAINEIVTFINSEEVE
jgi:catabolite repression HPr-like protein